MAHEAPGREEAVVLWEGQPTKGPRGHVDCLWGRYVLLLFLFPFSVLFFFLPKIFDINDPTALSPRHLTPTAPSTTAVRPTAHRGTGTLTNSKLVMPPPQHPWHPPEHTTGCWGDARKGLPSPQDR